MGAPYAISYSFDDRPHVYLPDYVGTLADGGLLIAEAGGSTKRIERRRGPSSGQARGGAPPGGVAGRGALDRHGREPVAAPDAQSGVPPCPQAGVPGRCGDHQPIAELWRSEELPVEERARLANRCVALEAVCMQMLAEDAPISVTAAFRRAGLPRTPRPRARRLGLVDLVERYAACQAGGVREPILAGWCDGMSPMRLKQTVRGSITLVHQVPALRPKGRAGRPRHIRVEQNGARCGRNRRPARPPPPQYAYRMARGQGTIVHPHTMRDSIHRLGWRRVNGCWPPPSGTMNAEQLWQRRGHRRAA